MKVKSRTALSGLAALLPLTLSAQSISWTGDATPDTDWATAGNWSSDPAVPTIANTVTIDAGHAFVTTTDAVADTLTVGDTTTGELTVSAGGVLTVSAGSILGAGMGSNGSATVTGAGASWNTGELGDLVVGSFGQGTLTISDGGVVNSAGVDLASGSAGDDGATQGTVRITGAGSAWNVSGAFKMGVYHDEETYTHASLTLAYGGSLTLTATEDIADSGKLKLYNNGIVQIGEGGVGGTLTANEIAFEDSAPLDPVLSPSGALATLAFNHTDDITLDALLSGGGLLTKTGSGTLTLKGNGVEDFYDAEAFGGLVKVIGGTLVLDVRGLDANDNYWNGDGKFTVTGGSTVLRIAEGTILANDLDVTDGTVEVAGALEDSFFDGNTFTNATLRVLSGGEIRSGLFTFNGDSVLSLDGANAISGGSFTFNGTSTLDASTVGAITEGDFIFTGNRTISLPGPGVIVGGQIVLQNNVSTTLGQAGMLSAFYDADSDSYNYLDLTAKDTAHITISAAGAVENASVTLLDTATLNLDATGGMVDSELRLLDGASLAIGADEVLENTAVTMTRMLAGTPTINLNGHNVTFSGIDADVGEIINNSANDSTVTFAVGCGCGGPYSTFFAAFTEQGAGKINVRVVGGTQLVMGGAQTYTGSTVVDGTGSGLYFVNTRDEDFNPVPSVLVSSPITLRNGGVLGGDGTVNAVSIENGGTLAPGDFGAVYGAAGTLTTGPITITNNSLVAENTGVTVDIYDATGPAGVGTDFLNVLGDFTFSGGLNDTFTIRIRSVDDNLDDDFDGLIDNIGDADDLALNFDPGLTQSWQIASFGGGVFNFDTSRIIVDGSLFKNAVGLWTITRGGIGDKDLFLHFAPIPEPAAFALLGSLGVLPALLRRRRR